jgi:hypothetical protein
MMAIMQPALVAGHPIAPVLSGVKGNNTKRLSQKLRQPFLLLIKKDKKSRTF